MRTDNLCIQLAHNGCLNSVIKNKCLSKLLSKSLCVCVSVYHFTSLKTASLFANWCCIALQQDPNAQWMASFWWVWKSQYWRRKMSLHIFGIYLCNLFVVLTFHRFLMNGKKSVVIFRFKLNGLRAYSEFYLFDTYFNQIDKLINSILIRHRW